LSEVQQAVRRSSAEKMFLERVGTIRQAILLDATRKGGLEAGKKAVAEYGVKLQARACSCLC
jgi:hypothetical protein